MATPVGVTLTPQGSRSAAASRVAVPQEAAYQQSLRCAEDVRRLYRQLQRAISQSLVGLANALEAKDSYTRGHSERVGALGRHLGLALGLSSEEADTVAQSGLLHDIGKIGVPEAVLRKRGPLDPEEWDIMKRHPLTGAQIVAPFEFFAAGALIIRHHHERLDGSGYPDGLVGDAIPIGARIIAVADVWDALTSDRPYRAALPPGKAEAYLREQAGVTLDARAVDAFLHNVAAIGLA
jgi:HD-GYP domain-containing protein (c-di-GMP phosphodiesterase class II)